MTVTFYILVITNLNSNSMKRLLLTLLAPAMLAGWSGVAMAEDLAVGSRVVYGIRTYETVGENMITNGSFEDGFTGWTIASDFTTEISGSSDFELRTDSPKGGSNYLVGTSTSTSSSTAGANGTSSLGTAWEIEAGKTYYFCYWIKNLDGTTETEYLKTSLTNTLGEETSVLGYPASVSSDWQRVEYMFTNDDGYKYLQVKFRWLASHWGFDDFQLYEIEEVEAETTYEAVGENMITNGSFEDGFTGWTIASDFTTEISGSSDFELRTDSPKDGDNYLVGTSTSQSSGTAGSSGTSSLGTAWEIEAGKTYYFCYWIKNLDGTTETEYLKTSLTNTPGEETSVLGYPASVSSDWQRMEYMFTNDDGYKYLQVKFRWLASHWGFDDFQLYEIEEAAEVEPETIHECEAEFDDWSIAGNSGGSFQLNNWSTENDESGMVIPFIEYWVGSGGILSDATISHTQLTGLETGYYDVSIFARAFNENSTDAVSEGITFNANGESVDLTTGTTAVYNGVSTEVYGTYDLLVYVTGGTLDINFAVSGLTACDWVAFKNLAVTYFGEEMPTLKAVTGKMNAEVEAAMNAAIDAYNTDKTAANYYAAVAAREAAEASVAYYAPIEAAVEALDEAGTAVWQESQYAAMYDAGSLTSEDVSADLAAAQKVQTTAGSDMTYVVLNEGEWTATQGDGPSTCPSLSTATETYNGSGAFTEGDVLCYTLTGLQAGTYTVTFYAVENSCNGVDTTTGDIAEAFANSATSTLTVSDVNNMGGSWEGYTAYTLTCTVDADGELTFGVRNTSEGGNWCVAEAVSLTLLSINFNDDEYAEGDTYESEDITYTIVGNNIVVNGGFNDGVDGWQANFYSQDADISNFGYHTEGGFNDGHYITVTAGVGAEDVHTLCQAIQVEAGKQYLFIGYTNGTAPSSGNMRYNGLMRMDSSTHEVLEDGKTSGHDAIVEAQLNWGNGTDWEKTEQVFTAETNYVGVRFTWCNGASFDGIQLYEIEEADETATEEPTTITYTDELYVTLSGSELDPVETSVDVQFNGDNTINFMLKNFVMEDIAIGNIEVDGIELSGPEDGVEYQTFTYEGSVSITKGDLDGVFFWWGTMIGDVDITMTGKITEDKLYATLSMSVLGMDIDVVFGSDFPEDLSELIAQYLTDLDKAVELVAELEESIATNGADEAYDTGILAEMEEALEGLQTALDIYGSIDTDDTTKDTLTEAIAALEAAMETASNAYATAISSLATKAEGNDVIYTIGGTRVSKATKGVYIINGKKVLVK